MSRLGSRLVLIVAFLSLTFIATGCGVEDKASTIPQETAAEAIRARIEGAGVEVEWVSFRWKADFFGPSVRQATLQIGGADGSLVNLYRFPDAEEAAADAGRVSRDGMQVPADGGLASVSWTGRPHFFRQGRLIALFCESGDVQPATRRDQTILAALQAVMGPQFAGLSDE